MSLTHFPPMPTPSPETIRTELRKYQTMTVTECLECGYNGRMGVIGIIAGRLPWYLSWWWICIGTCGTSSEGRFCKNCGTRVVGIVPSATLSAPVLRSIKKPLSWGNNILCAITVTVLFLLFLCLLRYENVTALAGATPIELLVIGMLSVCTGIVVSGNTK
jgi:hypothetical protein